MADLNRHGSFGPEKTATDMLPLLLSKSGLDVSLYVVIAVEISRMDNLMRMIYCMVSLMVKFNSTYLCIKHSFRGLKDSTRGQD
jgi:hypothetical protein